MKPVNSSTYIDFDVENNEKDPKFGVGDYVRIQNIKLFLQNVTLQNSPKKFLQLKKLNILCRRHI